MGKASIAVGIVIVILNIILKERMGWGTLLNMFFIGFFVDILMLNNLIPVFHNILLRIMMMCLGMFIVGIASYFYISTGLGAGPRDGLMVALTKKTKKSVRFIRNSIEIFALFTGYFLGGFFGIGTLFMAISIGYFIQFAFQLFKFDVSRIEHRFIDQDIYWIKEQLINKNNVKTEE